jgi:MEMO1 family protein
MNVRLPAVAGTFYPGTPEALRSGVQDYLTKAAVTVKPDEPIPKALIVPHAGYIYSAPVAASAYARLVACKDRFTRVVLLGPAHRVPIPGVALPESNLFRTPLGDVPVDREGLEKIRKFPGVSVSESAHALEHSLEVQLPFLQTILDRFTLIPMVAGEARPQEVAAVLEALWDEPGTLTVISSDLCHYREYAEARKVDEKTAEVITGLRWKELRPERSCGCIPIAALLILAAKHHLQVRLADLRNSGDTAGPRDLVVGYGSFVVTAGL